MRGLFFAMRRLVVALAISFGGHLALLEVLDYRAIPNSPVSSGRVLNVVLAERIGNNKPIEIKAYDGSESFGGRSENANSSLSVSDRATMRAGESNERTSAPGLFGVVPILPVESSDVSRSYIPSEKLDIRPVPIGPVIVPPPTVDIFLSEQGRLVLELFVDEQGYVVNVEIESSDVPRSVADAAVETFKATRMRPGVKAGVFVKAKMKIQVDYDSSMAH